MGLSEPEQGGLLSAARVVAGLLFALGYRPFVAKLLERVRRLAIRGALVFVLGALGSRRSGRDLRFRRRT